MLVVSLRSGALALFVQRDGLSMLAFLPYLHGFPEPSSMLHPPGFPLK